MATQKSAAGVLPAKPYSPSASVALEEAAQQPTPYSQALSRLEPLQPVLAGLAHRNHNQHRRSAWWRYFGMLRRNCARLTEHLISAVAAARKDAARAAKLAKAKGKKRRREELASGDLGIATSGKEHTGVVQETKLDGMAVDANVTAHVIWLRDILIPKCYLAFSQLTADTQFAPLGVVLLATLAQVQAACECAVPRPAPLSLPLSSAQDTPEASRAELPNPEVTTISPSPQSTVAPAVPESRLRAAEARGKKDGQGESEAPGGLGKAISREDVERASKQRQKEKAGESKETEKEKEKRDAAKPTRSDRAIQQASPTTTKPATASSIPPSKRLAQHSGQDPPPPAKKVKTIPITRERPNDKPKDDKKKKKKAKKGDEFDDLFKDLF